MKKTLFLLVFALSAVKILAAEAAVKPAAETTTAKPAQETRIVYDVYKHMNNSNDIFLGIGGLSLGVGAGVLANAGNNHSMQGMGLENVIWGLAEGGFYIFNKNFGTREEDEKKAREQFVSQSGWHAVMDLGLILTGGCLAVFGNDYIKGHGMGIMIEAAMLVVLDGANFFIASNPQDVKDWGAGMSYNFKFASSR